MNGPAIIPWLRKNESTRLLSRASRAPASRAIPETSRTSVIFRRGFEGVSAHNSLVPGETDPPTSSAFVMSTKETSLNNKDVCQVLINLHFKRSLLRRDDEIQAS